MPYPDESNLTQLATLKDWLPIAQSDVAADTALGLLINRASRFICRYVSRDVVFSKAVTEKKDGNGQPFMMLNLRPITAITLVQVDQTIIPASSSQSYGYVFDSRRVLLIGYKFWWGYQNVTFQYTGGIANNDPDVAIFEQATLHLIATTWRRRGREEVVNKVMNGVATETFRLQDMPDECITMLSNVKNVAVPT